jgi:pimeloyl-ACP methyl ester carboxylesterase
MPMNTTPQTHHRSVPVDGVEIFYREAGDPSATTILLLHGFPTSSRMYAGLIPLLADRFHLLAPDYPAFGQSDVPGREEFDYTFDGLATIVGHFLDALGAGEFVPYMMDFGAPVGYRLTLEHPDRVPALVLQNAPLYPEAPSGWWATMGSYWADGSAEHREACRREYLSQESIADQYTHGVRDVSLLEPDRWILDFLLQQRPGVQEIMLDLLYDIRTNGPTFKAMRALLRDRRPPTLVATGVSDELFPGEAMAQITQDQPDAALHPLDTGHFALEDHAADVARLIRDFLVRLGL